MDDLVVDGALSLVHFFGIWGYISLWQDGDPLYVLDLSDLVNLMKTDELNVTDSLNYMHPIDNKKNLLAMGTATDEDWYSNGCFDVSDSSNPYEEQCFAFVTIGSSDAMSDHHAFRYIAEISMSIIPGYEYSWKNKIFLWCSMAILN